MKIQIAPAILGWSLVFCGAAMLLFATVARGLTAEQLAAEGLHFKCPQDAVFCKPTPPLALKLDWGAPPYTGEVTDEKVRATQAAVATPGVQLKIYGSCGHGQLEALGPPGKGFLWNGLCMSPVAVTLRDTTHYLDLSGPAKIRWIYRAANMHAARPVLRLADGMLIVGDHVDATPTASGQFEPQMVESEFSLAPIQWYQLNPQTVAVMNRLDRPDLSKVDAVGFADLMSGGGHGDAGWVNVGEIQVYGVKLAR